MLLMRRQILLYRKGGGIAFVDFDASLPHAEAARGGRCVGTAPYIAPEVASAGRLSEQADMYALAMVLMEHCPKGYFKPVYWSSGHFKRANAELSSWDRSSS